MLASFAVAFLLTLLAEISGSNQGLDEVRQSAGLQTAHAIGLALYSYANDNGGKYPKGNSSTEVFQQLIDGGYISDPTIFYVSMAGKTKASGKKLKPENVCWDVTDAVQPDDPDTLPIVFITGYRVHYVPAGMANTLGNPLLLGMPVYYKNNFTKFLNGYGNIHDVPLLDPTFDAKGKTYRQLTPDGPLP